MNIKLSLLLIFITLFTVDVYGQHDPARNAVRLLAKGQTDTALKRLATPPPKENSPISNAERYFVLTMAACRKGDAAEAFNYARQAVQEGLPAERFLAGPRDILQPLYANKEFRDWIQPMQKQLLHGPLLGAVTDTSASFWVRTAAEAHVEVIVKALHKSVSKRSSFAGRAKTSAKADYTAVIKISGLTPKTNYSYKILINNKETGPLFKFHTFPAQKTSCRFSIVFGGGAGFTPQNERMWTTIYKKNADALLLLGDNVYIDDPLHQMTQRYCYYRRQSQTEWRQLTASVPVSSIYDDHDFGTDDCIPGQYIEKPAWKRQVWNVFTQNWNNPGYGGGEKQPGCWYDFYIGDVHFIMLDCRYYRDLEGGSMLGSVQKTWLFKTLKSSKGKFKVLISSVPWSPGVKPGSKDTWDGYPAEREEIFTFLEKNGVNGVILMAADRHRTDFRKIKRPNSYDLFEVMSSRLTNVHFHDLLDNARGSEFIMGYNKECSFGFLEFDTIADDPRVKFSIVNIDGKLIDSRTLNLTQLQNSPIKIRSGQENAPERK